MTPAERRQRLLAEHPGTVLLLPSARPARQAHDVEHRYCPDPDLYYLTGWTEPESMAVIRQGNTGAELTLFVRPRDPVAETWTGRRLGPEGAREHFDAMAAHPMEELSKHLPPLLTGREKLVYPLGRDRALDALVLAAVDEARHLARRQATTYPVAILRPDAVLGAARIVKDADEVAAMGRACRVTIAGFRAALQAVRPGLHERDLEAIIESTFRREGAEGPANPSIVGSGANATVLHYCVNNAPLTDGDLVLVDAGAQVDHYCGDITRTFPVNGRYTPQQREVYDIVLAAQQAAIRAVEPGATLATVHRAACLTLIEGLCRLQVLSGDPEELLGQGVHSAYYPHKTSHWLGLDVHDPGPAPGPDSELPLQPDMILTVEPGLYFPPDKPDLPAHLAGLGIRIEDDVRVTPDGREVLTADLPTDPDEIEEMIRSTD